MVSAKAPVQQNRPGGPTGGGPDRLPSPVTIDQIIHDQGNIATTVDNWGYVGGYSFSGLPSGQWPLNSGHDYLAEIRYWIGTTDALGDTLVANTLDDFQSIPSLVNSVLGNQILLSTDTTRYHDDGFDPTDTVGAGYGNPARGWKIWSSELSDWVYTQNYSPIFDTTFEGGPLSVQESHYRFADDAMGTPLLDLEMTHTVLQWNFCYNQNFMFFILEIKNTSTTDYTDVAFGLYVDLDVGGPDGTGENGRLGDLVGFDSTESLAWIYDEDGYDLGWGGKVTTGYMGTKYLETPGGGGMTAFRTNDWALLPDDDPGRFAMINSTQFDASLPPTDQFYIQCTRGITIPAGTTVRVVYALVAGADEQDFRDNAALAQTLYDNNFIGPSPPTTPSLTASAGDGKIYLHWNDTAQVGFDPLSGENDFSGYKLYRSDNRGKTWGTKLDEITNDCLGIDYETLATYVANTPTQPIARSIIDTGLINGVEYWYCVAAFDTGASASGVDVLQSGFGTPNSATNVVSVTPRTDPAGHLEAAGLVKHEVTGTALPSDGTVFPVVFDRTALLSNNYEVVFEDSPKQTFWHLRNSTTGDTILKDQTKFSGDPNLYEVAEGIRVVVREGDYVPRSYGQTVGDSTLLMNVFEGPAIPALTGNDANVFGSAHFRSNYELRFGGDSTLAISVWKYWYPSDPDVWMPFEIWNTTTNQRVSLAVNDLDFDGVWQPYDEPVVVNYPYNPATDLLAEAFPFYYGWMWQWDDQVYNPAPGDIYEIQGAPLNGPEDVFSFTPGAISASAAKGQLGDIKVVPDPYYAFATLWELNEGENVLQFQNLPDRCSIRIYTLSGDRVRTLEHDNGSGTEEWDLLTEGRRQVASGMYIYHVESEYGEHLGRFAVVK